MIFFGTERFLRDILEEHRETLPTLWTLRRTMFDEGPGRLRDLIDLDERIAAHSDGLVLAGEEALPILEEGLKDGDATVVLSAAYCLLCGGHEEPIRRLIGQLGVAEGATYEGIRRALCRAPIGPFLPRLGEILASSTPKAAVAAAEVLACQAPAELKPANLARLLSHDDPAIRRDAWHVAARLRVARAPKLYQAAMADDDPDVRRAALYAAAWGAQSWVVDRCRAAARKPGPETLDELRLLAILGGPDDLPALRVAARTAALGQDGPRLLGAFGHPEGVEDLIGFMGHENPRVAVAAGRAFARITGRDVESAERVPLPPEDGHEPDDFEKAFLDEEFPPDPRKARVEWDRLREPLEKGLRWRRGAEIRDDAPPEVLDGLDLVSRGEAYLRARFRGNWSGGLVDLERFPQRVGGWP